MARKTRRQQQRESAQRCRDRLSDGYIMELVRRTNAREWGDRDADYLKEAPNYIETYRTLIWAKRVLYDRGKWKNHPAAKEWAKRNKAKKG
jgi:hypothetical protein